MVPEIRTFRCGHIRDAFNTAPAGKSVTCRTCKREQRRFRYRQMREEGLTPNEIFGYRPLTEADLGGMLGRMKDGMTICQATAGPSGYERSTTYRKLRIWAPNNHERIVLIKRLSKLNAQKGAERRWQARRARFEPGMFPRIDPAALDFDLIERVVCAVFRTDEQRSDLRHLLIVDLLDGCCSCDNLHARALQHKEDHYRHSQSRYGLRSFEAATSADGSRSLGDKIAWEKWKN